MTAEIDGIWISSGVNHKGEPFCTVTVEEKKRIIALGQLPPGVVRKMALQWLGAAEAAESDAAVFQVLQDILGDKDEAETAIGGLIARMRTIREAWGEFGYEGSEKP